MRTVVESPKVMEAVDDAAEHWARADDAWSTITWVLAHDETVGLPITEGGHLRTFVFEGSWAHEMPTIYVLYEIQDDKIIIQDASFRNAVQSGGLA